MDFESISMNRPIKPLYTNFWHADCHHNCLAERYYRAN